MPTAPAQPQPPVTPRTAHASQRPCELYAHSGSPRPTRTQGHHRHPVYLQNRVYGQIRDPELLWVCGLCHDSIHAYLDWLLGDASKPDPMPGWRVKQEAARTVLWYLRVSGAAP
jgi:hypothetical protein